MKTLYFIYVPCDSPDAPYGEIIKTENEVIAKELSAIYCSEIIPIYYSIN